MLSLTPFGVFSIEEVLLLTTLEVESADFVISFASNSFVLMPVELDFSNVSELFEMFFWLSLLLGNFKLSASLVVLSRDLAFTSRLFDDGLPEELPPLVATVSGLDVLVEDLEGLDGFELTLAATFLVEGVVAGLGLMPLEALGFSGPSADFIFEPESLDFSLDVEELTLDFRDNLGDVAEVLPASFERG